VKHSFPCLNYQSDEYIMKTSESYVKKGFIFSLSGILGKYAEMNS